MAGKVNIMNKNTQPVYVFNDFSCFNDFKKGLPVRIESIDLLSEFQNKLYYPDKPPVYSVIPQNNSFFDDNKIKYFILAVGDDLVLLQYRIIQIFQNKIIKILDAPISKNSDINSVKTVIQWLKQFDFVKFVYPEFLSSLYGNGNEVPNYNNFYFDVNKTIERFSTNQWMKKSKMNSFEKSPGFSCKYLNSEGCRKYADDISELIDMWCADSGHKVDSKKYVRNIIDGKENLTYICIFYNDTLLSIEPVIVLNGYAFSTGFFHIGRRRDTFSDNPKLRTVCGHLSDISEYHIIKYLKESNCFRFYVEGSRLGNTKSLYNHKLKRYDGFIKYYEI